MEYLLIASLGWLAGVIVNYISDVLPRRRRFSAAFCLHCDNSQPLINYILWPRRCNKCGKRRHFRTWLVEGVYVGLSIYLWISSPDILSYFAGILLLAYFGVIAVIDIEHRLILHPTSIVGALLSLGIGIWLHGLRTTLIGGIAGYGIMLILYYLGFLFLRLMSRWRNQQIDEAALGFGDVNLGGIIGLILGWPGIVAGLLLAIILGGATSLLYLLFMAIRREYRPDLVLPYGPFMIASSVWLLYFRDIFFR